jgi:hypothetical protein
MIRRQALSSYGSPLDSDQARQIKAAILTFIGTEKGSSELDRSWTVALFPLIQNGPGPGDAVGACDLDPGQADATHFATAACF